jgi:hypothetical protein
MAASVTRKRLIFAAVAMLLSMAVCIVVLLAADFYAHRSVERSAGLNRWGYRGPVVGRRKSGETRIAVLGGSTAFGYGVTWDQAFPAQLEAMLRRRAGATQTFSVVNLAYNNEGAYSFRFTLDDFAWLKSDVAVFYEGYNDLHGEDAHNTSVARRSSPVFRLTGYMPMLPLVVREKAMSLRYGGDLNAAYSAARNEPPQHVFTPSLAKKTAATALEVFADVSDRFEQKMPKPAQVAADRAPIDGCEYPWRAYCKDIADATDKALARGMSVMVVMQPKADGSGGEQHASQQRSLVQMLTRRFGKEPRVSYVSLADAVNLDDRRLAYDGMHLTDAGNQRIAARLVEPVLRMTAARSR